MVSANQNSLNAHSRRASISQSCPPEGRPVKPRNTLAAYPGKAASGCAAALAGCALAGCALVAALAQPASANDSIAAPAAATVARDPLSCQTVRFSDVGWTEVDASTALVTQLLRSIGYTPTVTVLSVPVTFASLQNRDIDVFLGNWMPAQEADRGHY